MAADRAVPQDRDPTDRDPGEPYWGIGDAVAGLGLALVFPSVVVVVALALLGVSQEESDTIPLWGVALLQLPLWAVLGGVPWWAVRRKGSGSLRTDLGLAFRPRDLWVGLLAGLGSQLALGIALIPVYDVLGIDRDQVGETAQNLADRAQGFVGLASLFLVAVLGAAILEELFYRGLLLGAFRKRWGNGVAIAGSAAIFGVMHFQPVDTIALGLFGAVCAWLTIRYDRLGPAICAHLAFNLTAFLSLVGNR
jgi:membrane protease YdiL (CAAX protease family)